MPRYTLHRPADAKTQAAADDLRRDGRVQLLGELPRMLLFESSAEVADEWAARLPGWKCRPEQQAAVPDPRPKLKQRLR